MHDDFLRVTLYNESVIYVCVHTKKISRTLRLEDTTFLQTLHYIKITTTDGTLHVVRYILVSFRTTSKS